MAIITFSAEISYINDKLPETITKQYDFPDIDTTQKNLLKRFVADIVIEEETILDYADKLKINIPSSS